MEKFGFLVLLIFIYTIQGIGFKSFINYNKQGKASLFLFSFISMIFMGLVPVIFSGIKVLSPESLLYAALFGICLPTNLLFYGKALEVGPLAYSALFSYGASVVPMIFGLVFFEESMGLLPIIGCVVIVIAFYLMTRANSKKGDKFSFKWLAYCLIAFATNATMLVTIKLNQHIQGDGATFSMWTAVFSGITTLFFLIYFKQKDNEKLLFDYKVFVFALMFGAPTAIGVIVFTAASAVIDTVILYPVVNGGLVVSMALISVLLFKDKINRLGAIGVLLGLIAVILFGM